MFGGRQRLQRERPPEALIYFLGKQRRSLRTTKILALSENLRSWHRQHKLCRAILITSSCCFYFEFGASTVLSLQASFPVWRNLKNVCHCICSPWEACLGLGSLCYSSNYDKTDYHTLLSIQIIKSSYKIRAEFALLLSMLYLDIMVNTKTPVSLLFGVTTKKESHFWQSLTIPATNHRCKEILHTDRRACGFLLAHFLFSIWLPFNDFQKLWHRSCPSVFSVWDFWQYPATFLSLILKYVKPYKQQLTREKPTGSDEQGKKNICSTFQHQRSSWKLTEVRGEPRAWYTAAVIDWSNQQCQHCESIVPWLGIINRCSFLQEFVIFLLDKKSLHNVLSEFRKNNSKVALCLWLEKNHKSYFH